MHALKFTIAILSIFFLIHNCVAVTVAPNGTLPLGVWVDGNTPTTSFYSFFFNSTVDDDVSLELTATGINVRLLLFDNDGTIITGFDTSITTMAIISFCSDEFPTGTGAREVRLSSVVSGNSFPYQLRINVTNGLIIPAQDSALYASTLAPYISEFYYIDVLSLDDPLRVFFNLIQFPTPMNDEDISIRFGQCADNFFSNNDFFTQYDHTTPFPLSFEISNSTLPPLTTGRYYIRLDIFSTDLTYGIGACLGENCNVTFISNPTTTNTMSTVTSTQPVLRTSASSARTLCLSVVLSLVVFIIFN